MIDFDRLVLHPCLHVFGEPATYTPVGGAPAALVGVFEEFHTLVREGDGVPVQENRPVLGVRAADIPGGLPARNDAMQVSGRNWAIDEILPDGVGHLKLVLKFASVAEPA